MIVQELIHMATIRLNKTKKLLIFVAEPVVDEITVHGT